VNGVVALRRAIRRPEQFVHNGEAVDLRLGRGIDHHDMGSGTSRQAARQDYRFTSRRRLVNSARF
jgi:hypothetical protein